ncbi:hypothetical protein EFM06_09025, partial [Lactobacillus helveticus]|nr:hypothetical protein [Lactobacillus helveticus]
NFKRHSLVSLLIVITWMIKARFARKSLYRCQRAKNFTAKTGRNVLNDGRINWQKLVCLAAVKLISVLKPVIDRRRRTQAQRPMNAVTVELLKEAVALGIPAEYVLFDSWFSSPKMFWQLKTLGLDSVGMLK